MTEQNKQLKPCIIVDIDGTLAIRGNRSPFDLRRVYEDPVNEPVADLVRTLSAIYSIIIFSGRDGLCKDDTVRWLVDNQIPFDQLHMRTKGDLRADDIVKEELYFANVDGQYFVKFILDDRDKVVKLWRDKLNLPCFQVAYGAF